MTEEWVSSSSLTMEEHVVAAGIMYILTPTLVRQELAIILTP